MTNYEILKEQDMLAEMEERLHKGCRGCFNYENCGSVHKKRARRCGKTSSRELTR